ncbi:MAG: CmpA/NrtA family ABC transporter substrate-binding protein [Acidimicrobiales bacterium]|nr:CmpA/NrtA family ABC transporter substrate-binding protein [Acidimicrobiales bacterium]
MDRRAFLRGMAVAGAGVGLGIGVGCGDDDGESTGDLTGATAATSGSGAKSTNRAVKLGFIALTDCSSILMAKELGYFEERGLDVTIEKQASWPATRDNLLTDQIDGCHGLYTLPLSVATGIGGDGRRDIFVAMMLNNNGQAITLANSLADAGYGDPEQAGEAIKAAGGSTNLAMTFPGGTHDLWLRYWLLAAGIPFDSVGIEAVPPPQMVQNMSVGNVQGYCVGEPWGAVAVRQDIGFTHLATQDLWEHHPEKAFLVTRKFKEERPDVVKDCMAAILRASRWLDDFDNRAGAAEIVGQEHYINAPAAEIAGRLGGVYDLGADLGEKDFKGQQMTFFRDGLVNLPRKSHYFWALAQYQRFGYLKEAPPYQELADELILSDLYAEVAATEGIDIPDDDMQPFDIELDGVTFDPAHPDEEASRT